MIEYHILYKQLYHTFQHLYSLTMPKNTTCYCTVCSMGSLFRELWCGRKINSCRGATIKAYTVPCTVDCYSLVVLLIGQCPLLLCVRHDSRREL